MRDEVFSFGTLDNGSNPPVYILVVQNTAGRVFYQKWGFDLRLAGEAAANGIHSRSLGARSRPA